MDDSVKFIAIRKAGLFFFMVFALLVFVAKGAVNIAFSVVMLLSVLDLILNRSYRELLKNRYFLAFFIPVFSGLVLSLFSDAGIKGPCFFFIRYRFLFLCLPFFIFIREKKHVLLLFACLGISGLAGACYGFVMAEGKGYYSNFKGRFIIGRNSDLLASLCLMNSVLLFEFFIKEKPLRLLPVILFTSSSVACSAAVLVIMQRGAVLGLFLGLLLYGVFFNRKFLTGLLVVTFAGVIAAGSGHPFIEHMKTIADFDDGPGNQVRIQLLGSGIPYVIEHHLITGTGEKKPEESFTEFFKKQDEKFQKKFSEAMKLPGNFHNSFLQMAAEGGLLFFFFYIAGLVYISARMIAEIKNPEYRTFCIGAIIVMFAGCVTFSFHGELFRYGGLVFCLALYSGCVREKKTEFPSTDKYTASGGETVYGAHGPVATV